MNLTRHAESFHLRTFQTQKKKSGPLPKSKGPPETLAVRPLGLALGRLLFLRRLARRFRFLDFLLLFLLKFLLLLVVFLFQLYELLLVLLIELLLFGCVSLLLRLLALLHLLLLDLLAFLVLLRAELLELLLMPLLELRVRSIRGVHSVRIARPRDGRTVAVRFLAGILGAAVGGRRSWLVALCRLDSAVGCHGSIRIGRLLRANGVVRGHGAIRIGCWLRANCPVGLCVLRRSRARWRSNLDRRMHLRGLRLNLPHLRHRQWPAAIGLNGLLLLRKRNRWRRRSRLRDDGTIRQRSGRLRGRSSARTDHRLPRRRDRRRCSRHRRGRNFPLVHSHAVL